MIETGINTLEMQRINWQTGNSTHVLDTIHDPNINIAIYQRDIGKMQGEIAQLMQKPLQLKSSGDISTIMADLKSILNQDEYPLILQDISQTLMQFAMVSKMDRFRLLLATVNSNMCRRFHTDINDIRLLCTYSGPGTMWLKDTNINRDEMLSKSANDSIAIDINSVQQVPTGAIALRKGALYPNEKTNAVVHRSPTIEETGKQRLLLRIDTNETLKLWK